MPNVQIRDVPDDVHEALVHRAKAAGQSLQQFLAGQLERIAETPTIDEMLDRIERRSTPAVPRNEMLDALDDERARR